MPWNEHIDVISSDESSSSDGDGKTNDGVDSQQFSRKITIDQPAKEMIPECVLMRRAEMYQDYMRKLPIPAHHGSVIPFTSWVGLGKSIKQLYGQPLHYLTNVLLNRWDRQKIDSENDQKPLDVMIHPCKAEATVWLIEEIHRLTSSHQHIAKLWLSDPMHHTFVDAIFPQL